LVLLKVAASKVWFFHGTARGKDYCAIIGAARLLLGEIFLAKPRRGAAQLAEISYWRGQHELHQAEAPC